MPKSQNEAFPLDLLGKLSSSFYFGYLVLFNYGFYVAVKMNGPLKRFL